MIVYKKTGEWYIEWQRMTTNKNEWYKEWQRMTTSDNEWYNQWQRVTKSGTTGDNEWQRVTMSDKEWQRVTASDTPSGNNWQQMAMIESEWQKWYNEWNWHSTLQRMDNCHPCNNKNRYTATSRDGWLQLEGYINRLSLRSSEKVINKLRC